MVQNIMLYIFGKAYGMPIAKYVRIDQFLIQKSTLIFTSQIDGLRQFDGTSIQG